MAHGTHDFEDDARNQHILIWVNGELVPRERAVVSVFDAGFVLGDGVWEGLRVRAGHPAFLERHLDRLYEGARAIMLHVGLGRRELPSCHPPDLSPGARERRSSPTTTLRSPRRAFRPMRRCTPDW